MRVVLIATPRGFLVPAHDRPSETSMTADWFERQVMADQRYYFRRQLAGMLGIDPADLGPDESANAAQEQAQREAVMHTRKTLPEIVDIDDHEITDDILAALERVLPWLSEDAI